ncbi:hypothetical protein [Erysipelothrix rhusiopathiae]|uniref:hypothetical protein n=1 Tax=Erysipelothrix rhusiopathiae TaxID=1648 RepID=UPI002952B608|nr:hypothetical protein [Erysipelothrix rhusiopathiae]MDV7679707.1 hypothetical protein [Erysipelothrix rhusiopathiae]
MNFFKDNQIIFHTSSNVASLYEIFNNKYGFKTANTFVLMCSIGAHIGKREKIVEYGKEFRSNYLTHTEQMKLYCILLNVNSSANILSRFEEKEFKSDARKILEEYAESGAMYLINHCYATYYNNGELISEYDGYLDDLLNFSIKTIEITPF